MWSSAPSFLVLAMATGWLLDDLTLVGIVGIIDPERPQVEKAVNQLHASGVIVKMITGDAEKTAKAIGELTAVHKRKSRNEWNLSLI